MWNIANILSMEEFQLLETALCVSKHISAKLDLELKKLKATKKYPSMWRGYPNKWGGSVGGGR